MHAPLPGTGPPDDAAADPTLTGVAPVAAATTSPSVVTAERVLADPATWDAWVEGAATGTYLQLRSWARVKSAGGWRARQVAIDRPGGPVGAQVLLRRRRPLPWAFAYAPRAPFGSAIGPDDVGPVTRGLRDGLRSAGRVALLRADPEIEIDGPLDPDGAFRAALRAAGWRPGPHVQQPDTWLVDLQADEDALWTGLRRKWRQYVNKARSAGVVVRPAGAERLDDFYRIIDDTARRVGFLIRAPSAYRAIWDVLAPEGRVELLFADAPDGEPLAVLFHIRCGGRVVEPFGGMIPAGAELRANYLLKWAAIARAREQGARQYDMWGLVNPGITHFKSGFGGRPVRYIGAWDLVVDPIGARAWRAAHRASIRWTLWRHGRGGAGGDGGGGGDGMAEGMGAGGADG
jgi:lipid II:glycine glycyltransferase (peptidoglycan interpeptide bridge formation enzyme)